MLTEPGFEYEKDIMENHFVLFDDRGMTVQRNPDMKRCQFWNIFLPKLQSSEGKKKSIFSIFSYFYS